MAIAITSIEVASNVREDLGDLEELTASIREHGILQPIVVTGVYGDDSKPKGFRVLEGHRRLAAAAAAGYETVPAIFDHRSHLGEPGAGRATVQLVENLQRADLNELEIAHAIAAVLEADSKLTHAAVGRWIGKDRSWVSNVLRLLETAPEVQAAVLEGKISATHARAIAAVDVDLQSTLLEASSPKAAVGEGDRGPGPAGQGRRERIRDRDAGIAKRLAEAIAMLEKVANRDKAIVCVEDYYTGTEIKKGLTADGWHVTNGGGVQIIKESGECGCAGVWRLAIPYNDQGHVALHPACNSAEHATARREAVDAQWRADVERGNAERRAAREAEQAAMAHLRTGIVDILAEDPATPLARRLTLYALLDGEIDDALADEYLPDWNDHAKNG
jgi:ParB/RepB/Spo0J family partition protein